MGLSNSGFSAWDDFWGRRKGKGHDSWAKRRVAGILSRYIEPGMDVLDMGCGAGFFSAYFISRGCNVYSMDYSEKALSMAKDITGCRAKMYINGDILDADVFAGIEAKFDIIFTDGLLEHYSGPRQDRIISKMKAVKKEKGHIINFAPNRFSLWSIVRPFVMDIKERPFTMSGFIDLHRRNGLEVISSGGINVLPLKISPEGLLGRYFGMLFYCVSI